MPIIPYLLYEDVAGTMKWLAKAFGFRKYGVSMKGPDGKTNHAAMKLGEDVIMMGYPGPKYKNPRRLGQVTQDLMVIVNDVDEHFKRAKKAGAKILEEPADQFYGQRRYGCADPEGHVWYFAQDIVSDKPKKRAAARSKPKRTRSSAR